MFDVIFIMLIGAIFVIVGYLVKFKEMVGFIPGYDPEYYENTKMMTNIMGIAYMLIGIITIGMAPYMVKGVLFYLRIWLLLIGTVLISAFILSSKYGVVKNEDRR
jgi:uncharacterized membrane protein